MTEHDDNRCATCADAEACTDADVAAAARDDYLRDLVAHHKPKIHSTDAYLRDQLATFDQAKDPHMEYTYFALAVAFTMGRWMAYCDRPVDMLEAFTDVMNFALDHYLEERATAPRAEAVQ